MKYTTEQIEIARRSYNSMMQYRTINDYDVESIGISEATRRCDEHNNIIDEIKNGNKELEKTWKMFFLNSVVASQNKEIDRKEKQDANFKQSQDVLQPLRVSKKITAFYKWIDQCGNPFRKQHYSKKYTTEAVNSFFQNN